MACGWVVSESFASTDLCTINRDEDEYSVVSAELVLS